MRLAVLAVSSCPESTSTITRSRGDPSGEEMKLIGKGWITHCRLPGKAASPRLRLATTTLKGKKHSLIFSALNVCDDPGGWEGSELEPDHCLS